MADAPTPDELIATQQTAIEQNDPIPAIVYLGYANARAVAPCTELEPYDTLLSFGVLILNGEMPFPQWVAVSADTYEFDGEHGEGPEARPGDLARLFGDGDPRVTEAVYGLCIAPDGPNYAVIRPYVRRPDGSVRWGRQRVEMDVDHMSGQLPEAMRALLGYDVVSGT